MIKVIFKDKQEVHVDDITAVTYVEASGFFEFADETGNVVAAFNASTVLYYIEEKE